VARDIISGGRAICPYAWQGSLFRPFISGCSVSG